MLGGQCWRDDGAARLMKKRWKIVEQLVTAHQPAMTEAQRTLTADIVQLFAVGPHKVQATKTESDTLVEDPSEGEAEHETKQDTLKVKHETKPSTRRSSTRRVQ